MRTTKAAAQQQIMEDQERLSQALLHHENACAVHIERAFKRRVPTIGLKTVRGVRDNHDLRESWVDAATSAVNACEGHVENLARYAAGRALVSIRRELQAVEATLPARYDGLTNQTLERVNPDKHILNAVGSWRGGVHELRAAYRQDQTHHISTCKNIPELEKKLFADGGVWWQCATIVKQWSQWVSIWTANTVRMDAMKRFNDRG